MAIVSATTSISKEKLSTELLRKAEELRKSDLFVGTTDAVLAEKQPLFLVMVGLKPVAEANSGHWEPIPDGRHAVFDDPVKVGSFLDTLGLHYRLRHDDYATTALVSLQPELLDTYETAMEADTTTAGLLFGYPETACRAFDAYIHGDKEAVLSRKAGDAILQRSGISPDSLFVDFRLSREHWQEEVRVYQRWQTVLGLYGLLG